MFRHDVLREQEEEQGGGGQATLFDQPEEKADKSAERLAALERQVQEANKRAEETNSFFAQMFNRRQPQQTQQPQQDQTRALDEQFFQNPTRTAAYVAQQMAAQQAAQVRGELYPVKLKMARDTARASDAEVFDKYASEVENWVRSNYGPEHHDNEFVWKQGLAQVKADKMEEIMAFKAEKKKAAAALNAPSRRGFSPEDPETLTDDEKDIAARVFQMSEKDYLEAKKALVADRNVPYVGRSMTDSSFADVTTLDSRKPSRRIRGRKTA